MTIQMFHSSKQDGNTSIKYDIDGSDLNNRKKFFATCGISVAKTLPMKVKYSDVIVELAEDFLEQHTDLSKLEIEANAIITNCPNVFLYLSFGDCIPLVVFDSKKNVFAFAHMGWQSTELNLHIKIVEYLKQHYGSKAADLEVMMGPSIKKESYVLNNPSQLKHSSWKPFLNHVGAGNYEIDLNGYICAGMRGLGITKFQNSPVDTVKNFEYFSHYRVIYKNQSEKEGRFICGAMMQS